MGRAIFRRIANITALVCFSVGIPERVRRPSTAREALGFSPLVQAGWAHASCIERVPFTAAGAKPLVLLAGRPAAERALDARRFRLAGLLIVQKLPVWNDDRIISDRTHCRYYDLRS
jgi:hypothetical protein